VVISRLSSLGFIVLSLSVFNERDRAIVEAACAVVDPLI